MMQVHMQTVQPVAYAQPQVVQPMQYSIPTQRRKPQMHKRSQWSCGALQISFGVLNVIFTFIAFGTRGGLWYCGTGIWCGVWMIAAGACGIQSAKTERLGYTQACLGLSICAWFFGGVASLSMWSAAIGIDIGSSYSSGNPNAQYNAYPSVSIALDSLAIVIGVTEFVVSIVQAALCCHAGGCGCDCYGSGGEQTVVYVQQPHQPQVQAWTPGPQVVIQ